MKDRLINKKIQINGFNGNHLIIHVLRCENAQDEDNWKTKNIENVKVGEQMMTFNEKTNKFEAKRVANVFEKTTNGYFILEFKDGSEFKVTKEHPWLTNNGWVSSKELKPGSTLRAKNGFVELVDKNWVEEKTNVYNFETEGNHTYLVGSQNPKVVHNLCVRNQNGYLRRENDDYLLKPGELEVSLDSLSGRAKLNGSAIIDGETYTVLNNEVFDESGHKLSPDEIYSVVSNNGYFWSDLKQEQALLLTISFDELESLAYSHLGEENNKSVIYAMAEKSSSQEQSNATWDLLEQQTGKRFENVQMDLAATAAIILASEGSLSGAITNPTKTGAAGTFSRVGSLEGKGLSEVIHKLESNGFTYRGSTSGNYHKFYGQGTKSNRMEVWIRANGEVIRIENIPGSKKPNRFDYNGNIIENHQSGEFINLR